MFYLRRYSGLRTWCLFGLKNPRIITNIAAFPESLLFLLFVIGYSEINEFTNISVYRKVEVVRGCIAFIFCKMVTCFMN